jgi:hypothetical protein
MPAGRPFARWVRGVLFAALVALGFLPGRSVWAQSSAALPFYVSDRFQEVGKKVLQQVALEVIQKACPPGKPLCDGMLQDLAKATSAAFLKDRGELKARLGDFFVSSSSAALMEVSVGPLIDADGPAPDLSRALAPLARCLGNAVRHGEAKTACTFSKEEVDSMKAALDAVVQGLSKKAPQDLARATQRLVTTLEAVPPIPGDIARALADLASTAPVRRPDLQIYLRALGDFLDRHPETGLFDAAYAFVSSVRPLHLERSLIDRVYDRYELFVAPRIGMFADALDRCDKQHALIEKWKVIAPLRERFREDILLSRPPDLEPLEQLISADERRCGDSRDRQMLTELKSAARTLKGQLEVTSSLQRLGVPALLAASAIEFARTGNQVALDSAIRRTVAFGLAQAVAHAQMKQLRDREQAGLIEITALTTIRARDVLRSCAFQTLSILEQIPIVVDSATPPRCGTLKGGAPQSLAATGTFTDLGAVPDDEIVEVLDSFAFLVMREREQLLAPGQPSDYHLVLGALLTTHRDKLLAAIKGPLVALRVSPADGAARAEIAKAALTLARDSNALQGLTSPPAQVFEDQFGSLLLMTATERDRILNKPDSLRQRTEARVAAALGQEVVRKAVDSEHPPLEVPALHRVVPRSVAATREERTAKFFLLARSVLEDAIPDFEAETTQSGVTLGLIVKGVTAGAGEQPAITRKVLLEGAADFLVHQVDLFTERLVSGSGRDCKTRDVNGKWRYLWDGVESACAAKALIDGAYKPIAEYAWSEDFAFTADSAGALADKTYRSLIASPALTDTMLILNVGLGANFVVGRDWFHRDPDPAESGFVALTLLDKIGLALARYESPSTRFEAGVFAGGFLDALVRVAAGSSDRYWLAGLTAGWTRVRGVDLGCQLHAGFALPFGFDTHPRPALGLSVVVPLSFVFE